MKSLAIKSNWPVFTAACLCLALITGTATAVPTIVWTGMNYPSAISSDGSTVAGNDASGSYETFRWTELTGAVLLGGNTGATGGGAGIPDISNNGLHISATVMAPDTLRTQGIWTKGIGWEISMPPVPTFVGPDANSYGSCWGLSGDGQTLTGFIWRYGQEGSATAHASTWNRETGVLTELNTPDNHNSRGNDVNEDGTVVVGWSETDFGTWQPTVWEDGGIEVISSSEWFTEAKGVSNDGDTVWGNTHDSLTDQVSATIWKRTDTGWQENILGVLPGTFVGYGQAFVLDMAEIGNIAVGYNEFTWGSGTGFVWTLNEGMVDAQTFFESYGIVFPEYFVIDNLTSVSDDGKTFCGFGHDRSLEPVAPPEGFVITLDGVSSVPNATAGGGLSFEPNYPNPFNPSTTIALAMDRAQTVEVSIYDAQGRLVRTLFDGALAAGRNEIQWDGRDNSGQATASGMYFSRAKGEDGIARSQRMMLVK